MILKNRKLVVVAIASITVLLGISTVFTNLDVIEAYAVDVLSNDNVAKTIQVRVTTTGNLAELKLDSFSRVGFVSGENNFLLESVPSKDKRLFYELVKRSLADDNPRSNTRMHVSIDVYSGDGEIIHSLEYRECSVSEYFVHGVDSKGKIFFTEYDGTVEIREVTKFACLSFNINVDPFAVKEEIERVLEEVKEIDEEEEERLKFVYEGEEPYYSSAPVEPDEGELFYNSDTNVLQKFIDGIWKNISGVGGPPAPRR